MWLACVHLYGHEQKIMHNKEILHYTLKCSELWQIYIEQRQSTEKDWLCLCVIELV